MYPALAVLKALSDREKERVDSRLEILWVGGAGGMEADLVKREGLPFVEIPAAGLHGVGLRALPGNLARMLRGLAAARGILRQFRPQAAFFTGGFVAVPVAVAGRTPALGAPRPASLLFVPDIEPGLALKALARFADHVAVSVKESLAYFPSRSRISVTGYPTRRSLLAWNAESARKALGLSAGLPTLLVFGGSKGARSINRAVLAVLPELLAEMQVVHLSGSLDWMEVEAARAKLSPELAGRYRAFPYLHAEMGAALAAADLAVSRAGASTLGEYPLFGLPAILVPYPYAWRYQQVNARYLAERGAARVLADEALSGQLLATIRELLRDRPRLQAMRQAMRSLAQPAAADTIANLLGDLACRQGRGRT